MKGAALYCTVLVVFAACVVATDPEGSVEIIQSPDLLKGTHPITDDSVVTEPKTELSEQEKMEKAKESGIEMDDEELSAAQSKDKVTSSPNGQNLGSGSPDPDNLLTDTQKSDAAVVPPPTNPDETAAIAKKQELEKEMLDAKNAIPRELLDVEVFKKLFPTASVQVLPYINQAMMEYKIHSTKAIAMFLAVSAHDTELFTSFESKDTGVESEGRCCNPCDLEAQTDLVGDQSWKDFLGCWKQDCPDCQNEDKKNFDQGTLDEFSSLMGVEANAKMCQDYDTVCKLALKRVDLGNCCPGDGHLYRGRGAITISGRQAYHKTGVGIEENLSGHPQILVEPDKAFKAAGWWWRNGVANVDFNIVAEQCNFMRMLDELVGTLTNCEQYMSLYDRALEALGVKDEQCLAYSRDCSREIREKISST